MKITTTPAIHAALPTRQNRAFSFMELMLSVSIIGALSGLGVMVVSNLQESGRSTKLASDVAEINSAIRVYLGSGGTLAESATADEVLEALKSQATGDDAKQVVGHRGSVLDPRVRGRSSKSGLRERAVWQSGPQRFAITNATSGYTDFYLDPSLGLTEAASGSRSTALKFSKLASWVWDFNAAISTTSSTNPADMATGLSSSLTYPLPTATSPRRLAPPVFDLDGGFYDYFRFPLPLTISNPNPSGSSRIYFSVNNGTWQVYSGESVSLPRNALNTGLQAYVASLNPDLWSDSASTAELYQTIYFVGRTAGGFTEPLGDVSLRTNLSGNQVDQHFDWGVPSTGYIKPNSLDFAAGPNFGVVPDQEFKIGEVTYFNGTTLINTNATSVNLKITLTLDVPRGTEQLTFPLRLLSTPNRLSQTADENADYVWIPNVISQFSAQIQGRTYYLHLRFGESTVNSFTTVDEFHVHENKTATGSIYGRLTQDGSNTIIPAGTYAVDSTAPVEDGWSDSVNGVAEGWENQWANWSNNWNR